MERLTIWNKEEKKVLHEIANNPDYFTQEYQLKKKFKKKQNVERCPICTDTECNCSDVIDMEGLF